MRLFNRAISLGLLFSSLALPVTAEFITPEHSQLLLEVENSMVAGRIPRQGARTSWGRRYCQKPRLTIRAKRLQVKRLYRYSDYCRRKILYGWRFYQQGNRYRQNLRVYIYNRNGDLIRKKVISLRKYSRRGDYREASLFISPEVGEVRIRRIESKNRGRNRYEHRNRGEYDDDDD